MTDWRPISEMPKDIAEGTRALLFGFWVVKIGGRSDEREILLCEWDGRAWNIVGTDYSAYADDPTSFAMVRPPAES